MAEISSSQLVLTRTAAGAWYMRPRADRNYRTPITLESIRRVYGSEVMNFDFSGKFGGAQRFQVSVNAINARGMDNMDGLLETMIEEVDIVKRFRFRWPQLPGTDSTTQGVQAKGSVGDNAIQMTGNNTVPIKAGRLIQFETNGKLYRVTRAPTTSQSATYTMGIYPNLVKEVPTTASAIVDVDSMVRFVAKPTITMNRAILLEVAMVVREALT